MVAVNNDIQGRLLTMYYKVSYTKAMDEYYSTRQIAKMLDLKTITIRRWIDKKLLPAYKLGKELRVKKKDFEKFMNDRRVKP